MDRPVGGGWSIWCAGGSGIILATAPAQSNARVANGIALHLIDGHFSSMALHELNKAATLSRWNLDVGDFSEPLEERAELVLGDVARKSTDENGSIVGIRELVHGLWSSIISDRSASHRIHAHRRLLCSWHPTHNCCLAGIAALVLGGGGGDAHRSVSAVDTLHLVQGAFLVSLIGETDETVSS